MNTISATLGVFCILFSALSCSWTAQKSESGASENMIAQTQVASSEQPKRELEQFVPQVQAEYPHDRDSYTQGLFFHNGGFYESTGQYGKSTFRKLDLQTGEALRKLTFDRKYFCEGSVILGDKLYVLTWTNKIAFVYDASTLKYEQSYSYPREGWGLTSDGQSLIASDGSARIYFLDAQLRQQRSIDVRLNGRPLRYLNELEYIEGKIWANIYTTDTIAIIDPLSGVVEALVDCSGLLPKELYRDDTDVLNGIAYDKESGKIYITGKNWPKLYEIKLKKK